MQSVCANRLQILGASEQKKNHPPPTKSAYKFESFSEFPFSSLGGCRAIKNQEKNDYMLKFVCTLVENRGWGDLLFFLGTYNRFAHAKSIILD